MASSAAPKVVQSATSSTTVPKPITVTPEVRKAIPAGQYTSAPVYIQSGDRYVSHASAQVPFSTSYSSRPSVVTDYADRYVSGSYPIIRAPSPIMRERPIYSSSVEVPSLRLSPQRGWEHSNGPVKPVVSGPVQSGFVLVGDKYYSKVADAAFIASSGLTALSPSKRFAEFSKVETKVLSDVVPRSFKASEEPVTVDRYYAGLSSAAPIRDFSPSNRFARPVYVESVPTITRPAPVYVNSVPSITRPAPVYVEPAVTVPAYRDTVQSVAGFMRIGDEYFPSSDHPLAHSGGKIIAGTPSTRTASAQETSKSQTTIIDGKGTVVKEVKAGTTSIPAAALSSAAGTVATPGFIRVGDMYYRADESGKRIAGGTISPSAGISLSSSVPRRTFQEPIVVVDGARRAASEARAPIVFSGRGPSQYVSSASSVVVRGEPAIVGGRYVR